MVASFFLKYFWFLIIGFGAANAWVIQLRARPLIVQEPSLKKHANRVSITLVLLIGIPSSLLGVIQHVGGFDSPFYIFSDDMSNGYLLAAWLVMSAMRLYILWWTWFTKGLESYLAITPVRISKPTWLEGVSGVMIIRCCITAIILGWFAVVLWNLG